MRKLASIRKILGVYPIEGADLIEVVIVDGWKVVVKKGKFQEGDLCVYFEIDSVLPIREEFEFLRKGCYVKKDWLASETNPMGEGFRLKTIKLRKQISQGLVIPLGDLIGMNEEDDVTDLFGVVKWDPPVPATLAGKVRGNFPSRIPKTDQERIQNLKEKDLAPYINDDFEVTIKLDGSSMTMYNIDGRFGVCSRNLDLDWENDQSTTFVSKALNMKMNEILLKFGNFALQGELIGPGIQGNREGLQTAEFRLFDIYDVDQGRYLNAFERSQMAVDIMNEQALLGVHEDHVLDICPTALKDLKAAQMSVEELLELADGPSINNPVREGLVFKSIQNPDFTFKAISNEFLIKGGE
jgi:RNA ligase (TIGR02306 family)